MKKTTSPCIFTVHGMANLGVNSKNRTFGWYSKFSDAEKAVKTNCCNIYEFEYEYMVIEEIPEGVFGLRKQEWWYKWNGKKFVKTNKPKNARFVMELVIAQEQKNCMICGMDMLSLSQKITEANHLQLTIHTLGH